MMVKSFNVDMQKVILFVADSNGCYPVPASKGGAVSTLVELLVEGNNKKQLIDMTVVSYYDKKAFELSKKYPHIHFVWVRIPWVVKMLDKIVYSLVSSFTHIKTSSFKSLMSLMYYTFKSSLLIRCRRDDIVVLEHNIPMVWMIKLSHFNGRYFHHLHNIPRTSAKCKSGLGKCSDFLCISQYMAEDIVSSHNPIGPVPLYKVKLLFNCIDTSLFHPIEPSKLTVSKDSFGISASSKILLFAGRITWEKGIDKILEALDFIQTANVELLVVGDMNMDAKEKSPYSQKLLEMSRKHEAKIHFTGYIAHNKLPELYNLTDIAILPSMWEEPAGLTMIEAMACGTPVITTRSGGIPEYVGDAAVVLDRDQNLSQNIAKNVDLLLGDKRIYNEYSLRGIKRIQSHFSSEDYIDKFVRLIVR